MGSCSTFTLQSHWIQVITPHRCLVVILGALLAVTIFSDLKNRIVLPSSKSRYNATRASSFHSCTKINSSGHNPGHHIPLEKVCDGNEDCPLGDDEVNCNRVILTRSPTLRRHKRSAQNIRTGIERMDVEKEFPAEGRKMSSSGRKMPSNDIPEAYFIVFRRSNPSTGLNPGSIEFGPLDKIVFYIHGYATEYLADGQDVKNALFMGTSDVDFVIIVDWRKLSLPEGSSMLRPSAYKRVSLSTVPLVASLVKDFIVGHFQDHNYVYLVGFSLGAQIAGTAARMAAEDPLGFIVDRVTGLDPAGPIFEYSVLKLFPVVKTNTIRSSDAFFVDIIHTSSTLGMVEPVGHVDFFVKQYDCNLPSCAHRKSVAVFIASLTKCSLISCPRSEECTPSTISSGGYLADKYEGRGVHDLFLDSQTDPSCSHFMNSRLPAKDRFCLSTSYLEYPPEECVGKPYLSECTVYCHGLPEFSVCSTNTNNNVPKISLEDVVFELQWQCGRGSESPLYFEEGYSRKKKKLLAGRR